VTHRIEIAPNNSLPLNGLPLVFSLLALPVVIITCLCLLLGYWFPLPFAVIELAGLAWAFQLCQKNLQYRELITVSPDHVVIERGSGKIEDRIKLSRHWSTVELEPPADRLKPNKLLLRTGMQTYVVASCLTDSERIGLWERLHDLIGPACCTPSI